MPLDPLAFSRACRLAQTIERITLTLGIFGSTTLIGLTLVFG